MSRTFLNGSQFSDIMVTDRMHFPTQFGDIVLTQREEGGMAGRMHLGFPA
ncbi:hypothetical protein AGMMS49944_13960 [Spirochaetia bacterium]|nr:hypothetical protein AGMMS49944_13960 [Spirochaetia bacterium]